ncbi:uncharacterized protein LOC119675666 [Teleopsis dalmanni]|uniref:uncharacterized protein LOC119675666 n=1 Tax=Teleopsis dalmanni TaxID=139649 RepID=UPI0018CE7512|nr:uncharacterized protein LOC119675666 [Teleopsis dalmanni]
MPLFKDSLPLLIALVNFKSTLGLLYPASTLLQLTASLSVPVIDLPKLRQISLDWGFQMNYELPYNLSSFYNIPIWPGLIGNVQRRSLANSKQLNLLYEEFNNETLGLDPYDYDYSAGEIYRGLQDVLIGYGYHSSCLQRSICELSQHPFADTESNYLTEILTFILSPTRHKSFKSIEWEEKQSFEMAEKYGFEGKECAEIYRECNENIFDQISKCFIGNIKTLVTILSDIAK